MNNEIKDYVMNAENAEQGAFRLTYAFNELVKTNMKRDQIESLTAMGAVTLMLFTPGFQIAVLPAVIAATAYFMDKHRKQNVSMKETFDSVSQAADSEFRHHVRPLADALKDVENWGPKDIERLKEFHFSLGGGAATVAAALFFLPLLPLLPAMVVRYHDAIATKAVEISTEKIGNDLHRKYPDLEL
jgi:cell division protein FtsX